MSLTLHPDDDRSDVMTGEVVSYDTGRVDVAQHLPPHAAAALARVPGPAALDPFERLVEAFLDEQPPNTARGYRTDLRQWVLWLIHQAAPEYRTHPLLATRPHVAAWRKHLEATPSPRTVRPPSAASVARKFSAVSELYRYAIELGVLDDNPVDNVKRPKVPDESQTVELTTEELQRIFDAAEAHSPRLTALVYALFSPAHASPRSSAPMCVTTATSMGTYRSVYSQLRRLAHAAGVASADLTKPHTFRHAFATEALSRGVPLQDRQPRPPRIIGGG